MTHGGWADRTRTAPTLPHRCALESKNGGSHGLRRAAPVIALFLAVSSAPHSWAQRAARLEIGGGRLEVSFDSDPSPAFRALALDWISRAATAVSSYYARFPVQNVQIALHVTRGNRVGPGNASGEDGPHIRLSLGSGVGPRDLATGGNSWLMTHEMVHLALSGVQERHHWIEEGLATYVEPIARARVGELKPEKVWRDMLDGMPQGEPAPGDRGLDHTPTWGRTYWGGAMFCLLADVEIRKATHNTKGLEDALRAVVNAGGTIETDWGLARVLAVGDAAIGAPILSGLYDRMKASGEPVDLDRLWRQLGVRAKGNTVEFDDNAPWASLRRAITASSALGAPGSTRRSAPKSREAKDGRGFVRGRNQAPTGAY